MSVTHGRVTSLINTSPHRVIFASNTARSSGLTVGNTTGFCRGGNGRVVADGARRGTMLSAYHRLRHRNFRIACLTPRHGNVVSLGRLRTTVHSSAVLISVVRMGGRVNMIRSVTTVNRVYHTHNVVCRISTARDINGLPVSLDRLGISLVSFSNRGVCNPGNVNTLCIHHGPHMHVRTRVRNNNRRHNVHSNALPIRRVINVNRTCHVTGRRVTARVRHLHNLHGHL